MSRIPRKPASSIWSARSGTSAVEFALIAPFLALLLVGMVDFSMWIWSEIQVGAAARAGAANAVVNGFNTTKIISAVTGATNLSGVTATPAPSEFYGCPSTSGISTVTRGITCPMGGTAGTYVQISAQANYTPIGPWPWVPVSLSSSVTVRID